MRERKDVANSCNTRGKKSGRGGEGEKSKQVAQKGRPDQQKEKIAVSSHIRPSTSNLSDTQSSGGSYSYDVITAPQGVYRTNPILLLLVM